jgi:hypothetical protein
MSVQNKAVLIFAALSIIWGSTWQPHPELAQPVKWLRHMRNNGAGAEDGPLHLIFRLILFSALSQNAIRHS